MLPTDVALIKDAAMCAYVKLYAADRNRFNQDFASAFTKLQELGVSAFHETTPIMKDGRQVWVK